MYLNKYLPKHPNTLLFIFFSSRYLLYGCVALPALRDTCDVFILKRNSRWTFSTVRVSFCDGLKYGLNYERKES